MHHIRCLLIKQSVPACRVLACTNCPDVVRVVMFVVTAAPVAMLVKGWDLTHAASTSSAAAVATGHLGMMTVCGKNFDGQRWPTSASPSRRMSKEVASLCDATEVLLCSAYVGIEQAGKDAMLPSCSIYRPVRLLIGSKGIAWPLLARDASSLSRCATADSC